MCFLYELSSFIQGLFLSGPVPPNVDSLEFLEATFSHLSYYKINQKISVYLNAYYYR